MGVKIEKEGIWRADGDVNENLFKLIPRAYNPTEYRGYELNLVKNLELGKTYTLQFWDCKIQHSGKTEDTLGVGVYWGSGNNRIFNAIGPSYFTNGYNKHFVYTFTITSDQAEGQGHNNLFLYIYNSPSTASGTRNFFIQKWKLEEGSIPTPWVPATTDDIYTSLSVPFAENKYDNEIRVGQNYIDANQFYQI